ncbi:poly-beta-hydroxybutyrate polymerase [mine drainage metagenome]|uniref:Poly-beta-hydroxybutyrate polymerase n=1 Tax=mine drainage metagenome TaxID=410659 RepID=A0A1J5RXJ7_9ZZZZ
MSAAPDPLAVGMQAMLQSGQAWTQGLGSLVEGVNRWLASQQPVGKPASVPPETLARLQQEFAARHARLWAAELARKPDDPAPAVALPEPSDRRFAAPEWAQSPIFDYLRQAYVLNAQFLTSLAEAMPLADAAAKARMRFLTRQLVDALAPSNYAATNPEFIKTALETQGKSITLGLANLIADIEKGRISMTDDAAFEVGGNLAATPGAVVFENELFQLIQYAPLTDKVGQRPLVMVPPCINKYYVLDLQPENSLVRYAVEQGNTVFMVSWVNPKADLGHLTWDDYLERGVNQALAVAAEICAVKQVNALGFCVGGTLLASALAVAAARGERPVAALTLLTTLLDFSEPGELGCFIDEASVAAREATIGKGGLLSGRELSSVFSSLRANDLIWQYVVGNYLKGGKPPAFDLLYWNADSTSLPGPFAAWYLRRLYLENGLSRPGGLEMCGVRADVRSLDMPAFLYASREDHIVPWKTSYQSRALLSGPTRFVLGASGHIAGVINPPAKGKRSHWLSDSDAASGDGWLAAAQERPGSWWPLWSEWLAAHAGKRRAARAVLGSARHAAIEPAPGRYVREKAA